MLEILTNRVIIEVSGSDSFKLLQNLSTNNLANEGLLYSYMINSQGRYLFDFFVFSSNKNCYLIDLDKQEVAAFTNYLNLFKLRSKVEIYPQPEKYKLIYSRQPLSDAIYSQIDPRYNELGIRSVICSKNAQYLNIGSSSDLYIEDKYRFAIPDGNDLIKEKSFPLEYGGEELHAISYNKGCYTGQEVVSRTKYQGIVRKKIYKVTSDSSLDSMVKNAEIEIKDDEGTRKIGVFASGRGNKGIALIKEEAIIETKSIYLGEKPIIIEKPNWRN